MNVVFGVGLDPFMWRSVGFGGSYHKTKTGCFWNGMRDVNQVEAIYKIEIWMREAIHLRKL